AKSLARLAGGRLGPLACTEAALPAALTQHYGRSLNGQPVGLAADGRSLVEATYRALLEEPFENFLKPAVSLMNRNRDAVRRDPGALESIIRDPIIIRLVQQILARAVEAGASGAPIQPLGEGVRRRLRVCGAV